MLTPTFELKQDEGFVYVYIRTPYIKISDVEYFIEECQFKFYVKPYFLRLNLPGKVVENGDESASYDVEKGIFTIKLPKMIPGYYFEDLDLLTKLLAPSGKSNINAPIIEVLVDDKPTSEIIEEDEENINWEWHQDIYDEENEHQLDLSGVKYGFGNQKSGVFYRLKDELKEIIENPNPDELTFSERCLARTATEETKFDPDHYLADYFDSERIQDVLNYTVVIENEVLFTDEEKAKLQQLPNKEYLLDDKEEKSAYLSLVDIMFAYAYNNRTTLGENTVESAWTISTLSSTLSWFERFTNLQDVFIACCRRSLSYPLYRHWQLCCKVVQDVKNIFHVGRRKILQCLIEILSLFNSSEPRYFLNELYITDYCVWIQKVNEKKVESLAKQLLKMTVVKEDVGLELEQLEAAALIVYDEQTSESSESSSSSFEDSGSDTEGETSSDEGSDSISVFPEVSGIFPEVSGSSQSGLSDGSGFGRDSSLSHSDGLVAQEIFSENETVGGVQILPSLFGNRREHTKPLVEVIHSEQNVVMDNLNCEGNACNCASKDDSSIKCKAEGSLVVVKETELQQTDLQQTDIKEYELSGKILDLSIND